MSVNPEIEFIGVILRSPASGGTTKNLISVACAEILHGV